MPISTLLFNINLETVAMTIKLNKDIKETVYGNRERGLRLSPFAEDGILYLEDTQTQPEGL